MFHKTPFLRSVIAQTVIKLVSLNGLEDRRSCRSPRGFEWPNGAQLVKVVLLYCSSILLACMIWFIDTCISKV